MFLDKILLNELKVVGESLLKKASLHMAPSNAEEMFSFLTTIEKEINNNSFDGLLIGNILFNFISSIDIRDRLTTSRIFEDIFSSLFMVEATDTSKRKNPEALDAFIELDKKFNANTDWKISEDLKGNKREKTDVRLGEYEISLKTLQGKIYNKKGEIVSNKFNKEVNVGSLSYRALLIGLIPNQNLNELSDRKKGLGSKKQMRNKVLDVINRENNQQSFYERLKLFITYVYTDDLYLVLKSHYKIIFYIIPADSFVNTILMLYEKYEDKFENVWSRWENNNLRLQWPPIIEYLKEFNLPYSKVDILLTNAIENDKIQEFTKDIKTSILNSIKKMLTTS